MTLLRPYVQCHTPTAPFFSLRKTNVFLFLMFKKIKSP